MEFHFTGFSHQGEFREFAFERIADDRSKTPFKVIVSMGLGRQYHIPVQEFPLLCRRLLEQMDSDSASRTLTFTERDMQRLADAKLETQRAHAHKKAPRRPKNSTSTSPWQQRVEPVTNPA